MFRKLSKLLLYAQPFSWTSTMDIEDPFYNLSISSPFSISFFNTVFLKLQTVFITASELLFNKKSTPQTSFQALIKWWSWSTEIPFALLIFTTIQVRTPIRYVYIIIIVFIILHSPTLLGLATWILTPHLRWYQHISWVEIWVL